MREHYRKSLSEDDSLKLALLSLYNAASGHGAQPCRQLLEGERLDQVVIGAGIEAAHTVIDRVPRREHQDGDVHALATEPACDLEAGDIGQPNIEDRHRCRAQMRGRGRPGRSRRRRRRAGPPRAGA